MARRKCESYKVFEKNVERSRAVLRIFDVERTVGQPSDDEKELLREPSCSPSALSTPPLHVWWSAPSPDDEGSTGVR